MSFVGGYRNGSVSVGTTATPIALVPGVRGGVVITNTTASSTVYLGGPNVTAGAGPNQGFPLAASTPLTLPTSDGAAPELYGIVASGTATVNWITP